MVDESKQSSLDALMGLSPSKQAHEKAEVEDMVTEELPQEDSEQPQQQEEQVEEKSEKDIELEKALKRYEDTRAWGNQAHQTAKELQKVLEENDLLTDEIKQRLESVEKGSSEVTENKVQQVQQEFLQQFELVKGVVFNEDEDPDAHLRAFSKVYGNDKKVFEEFATLEPSERIKYVVNKARKAVPIAEAIEEAQGDMALAVELMADKRAKSLYKDYKASRKEVDDSEDETPRSRPRVNGGNTPKVTTYKRQSLTNLATK